MSNKHLLTVFTPTYNRAHTLVRTYESLCRQTSKDFDWLIVDDGSTDNTRSLVEGWISENKLPIKYIYKENGGLYTGYNTAYENIETELCVCIDSDDYMPDDAVEKISKRWASRDKSVDYCGIVGLDFNVVNGQPIGGYFPDGISSGYYSDIKQRGDTKEVMRTDLMKTVSPMTGFPPEKDFNPFYMIAQIVDVYPILVENSCLCWVEYQIGADSMSQGKAIYRQFKRSPRSFAKFRIMQMQQKRGNSQKRKFKMCIHYVSACIFAKDRDWFKNTPLKLYTILALPFGVALNILIRIKSR